MLDNNDIAEPSDSPWNLPCDLMLKTCEDHLSRICAFFERLSAAKLTVNLSGCEFWKAHVVFLLNVEGQVQPVKARLKLLYISVPQSRELMRFGMAGYYRKFCQNF